MPERQLPSHTPKRNIWCTLDPTDGVPGPVLCLSQDSKGYLWLATQRGLARYDGRQFIFYTTEDGLVDNHALNLCHDTQGRLWIGTGEWFGEGGGGVSCFDGQTFTNYTTEDGLANNHVRSIREDHQGRIWFGTLDGLTAFDGSCFRTYTTEDGLMHNCIGPLLTDTQGYLWVGTATGMSRFDGQRWQNYSREDIGAPPRGGVNYASAICEDSQGRIWFGASGGLHVFDGQHFTRYTTEDGLVGSPVMSLCEDHRGRLWVGTWSGVTCFDGQSFTNYSTEDGLWHNSVVNILEDREQQLWFAHDVGALSYLAVGTLQLVTQQPANQVCIQTQDGRLWFDQENMLVGVDMQSGEQRKLPLDGKVLSLLEDSHGCVWVGQHGNPLCRYDSSETVWEQAGGEPAPNPLLFPLLNTASMLETRDGSFWVGRGHEGHLHRFVSLEQMEQEAVEQIPVPYSGVISHLFEDSQDRVWMGAWTGDGLSCYDDKELTTYTTADGLVGNQVMSIAEDDTGRVWVGTDQGLCCFDGQHFTHYSDGHGLESPPHRDAVYDAVGELWFATLGGVLRTDGKHFQCLRVEDGLPSNGIVGLLPQSDGSMLICTTRGTVRYQRSERVAPQIEITELVADQVYQNPKSVRLTATDTRLLTISYLGLSLATGRMRYSYRLQGHDEGWQGTWENQVRYENLPPGEYTFQVIAISRDLVVSNEPASLSVNVIPDPRDQQLSELRSDIRLKDQQLTFLQRQMGRKHHFQHIIGKSQAIEWVRAMMDRAIDTGLNVLVTGETGTGKELVASGIHLNSQRSAKPLIPFNCGAVSRELIGSELFGHRKGSFTGAIEDKKGLFEVADGGTVVLDEIGDMPLDVQTNLLRVLEERKVQRLGEFTERPVDVCVIAMTNRPLFKEQQEGRFREDLYYRLDGFHIYLPPLRDRQGDIPLLVEHFYQEACEDLGKELAGFDEAVVGVLENYAWPGNVRELRNEVHRACVLAEPSTPIQTYHFSSKLSQNESPVEAALSAQLSFSDSLDQLRRRLVTDALRETNGNRTHAAKRLGIDVANLRRLIRNLGIKS